MFKEFREFILKGNMFDLAVGVIIATAFGKVVTAFTELLLSAISFPTDSTQVGAIELAKRVTKGADGKDVVKAIDIAPVINSFINLLIVGFALFLVVKAYNTAKKRFEKPAAPAGPEELPADVKLLAEIRDLLKNKA
ncbi:large conductance mechanosensitive channel protein MscL [Luteolibacter soli]|uniref:Large conductance mechanosensitive channel protein MscL n=1 Tax=Luteolibacter soli TaxID=3135280 RepID=A0ABU9AV35_9BACT